MEDEKEIIAVIEFFKNHNICLKRVLRSSFQRTPDLESDAILIEVKSFNPDLSGKDSIINSLRDDLETAAKQFRDFDNVHNKIHLCAIFADFYSQQEMEQDVHTVLTGEFSSTIADKIFLSSYTLSDRYRCQIDGIIWFKNSRFRYAWGSSRSQHIFQQISYN